jgi:nitrilase
MKVKVAVVQDAPFFFNKEKTIQRVNTWAKKCSDQNCQLVVFPESFIPGYPRGFDFGTKVGSRSKEGRELYLEYFKNSIDLESSDLTKLESIAAENQLYLVIGITEQVKNTGSLYCSMLYISPENGLLGVHRKIKPTGQERVIWAESDGSSLVSFDTSIGKLGGLICWENLMPLARFSMYQQGVEIYIAPTADSRDTWTSMMRHIAMEGKCFVLGCNQFFKKSMYSEKYQPLVANEKEKICRGGSIIVGPNGKIIDGPLFDQAGVLIANLDLEEITANKLDFDGTGHYSRKDIFQIEIKNQPTMVKETRKKD